MATIGRIFLFCVALIAMVVAGLVGKKIANDLYPGPPSTADIPAILSQVGKVARLNKGLPKMLDEETRLDSVTTSPSSNEIRYNHTLVNAKIEPGDEILGFNDEVIAKLVNRACALQGFRQDVLDRGIVAVYKYSAPDGTFLTSVRVTKADCR